MTDASQVQGKSGVRYAAVAGRLVAGYLLAVAVGAIVFALIAHAVPDMPFLPDPVKIKSDLDKLSIPDVNEKLGYVFDALAMTKQRLDGRVPLIGFAGAPWTLLCYMVQGKGSKTFDEAKGFCYSQPETAHARHPHRPFPLA